MTNQRRVDPAIALVVTSLVVQEVGASVAVLIIPRVGALGVVLMRLLFSAVILLLIARPRLRGRDSTEWRTVLLFGAALAAMNGMFYEAIGRIPLGAAVTIELLGPLVLAVMLSRRAITWLWALLAFVGVALLGGAEFHQLHPAGVLFAFGAAAMWACYILGSRSVGRRSSGLNGLALSTSVAALLLLPFGIVSAGTQLLEPRWLGLGVLVAVCSSAIPYALDLVALRRLDAAVFGVLMSLLPAVAVVFGLLVLHQSITWLGCIAIAVVILASAGSALTADRRHTHSHGQDGEVTPPG